LPAPAYYDDSHRLAGSEGGMIIDLNARHIIYEQAADAPTTSS
jgi:hypothetical protein